MKSSESELDSELAGLPLGPDKEKRLLEHLLMKTERDTELATKVIGESDRALRDAEYLHDFFVEMSRVTELDYSKEVDHYTERLDELRDQRVEAEIDMEKAKALAKIVSGRLSYHPVGPKVSWMDKNRTILSKALLGLGVVLVVAAVWVGLSGIGSDSSDVTEVLISADESSDGPVRYENVGSHGVVEIVLLGDVSADLVELGSQLDQEFRSRTEVQIYIFDDASSADYYDKTFNLDLSGLSSQELAAEFAKYYPHWVATYFRDTNNDLNQIEIYQDDLHSRSQTVKVGLGN